MAMKEACAKGLFKLIKIPNCDTLISHLFYANNALFLGEWCKDNIKNLSRILRCFHVSSGLKVNFWKSWVFGIGANWQEVVRWAAPLGSEPAVVPLNYLGAPVGTNMKHQFK